MVRIDCEAIVKFFNNRDSKRIGQRRWLAFKDRILNSNYRVIFEHIKGRDNSLVDKLSRCLFFEQVCGDAERQTFLLKSVRERHFLYCLNCVF